MSSELPLDGDAFYCGCWQRPGHYVFVPGMKKCPYRFAAQLDSSKWQAAPGGYYRQGQAKVSHLADEWTILSFPDYSVDKRPGSHSTFALRGMHDFNAALALARELFPEIFERFTFEIIEAADASA